MVVSLGGDWGHRGGLHEEVTLREGLRELVRSRQGTQPVQRSCGRSMPGMLEGSGGGRDLGALELVSAAGLRASWPEAGEGLWRHRSHSCPIALLL